MSGVRRNCPVSVAPGPAAGSVAVTGRSIARRRTACRPTRDSAEYTREHRLDHPDLWPSKGVAGSVDQGDSGHPPRMCRCDQVQKLLPPGLHRQELPGCLGWLRSALQRDHRPCVAGIGLSGRRYCRRSRPGRRRRCGFPRRRAAGRCSTSTRRRRYRLRRRPSDHRDPQPRCVSFCHPAAVPVRFPARSWGRIYGPDRAPLAH